MSSFIFDRRVQDVAYAKSAIKRLKEAYSFGNASPGQVENEINKLKGVFSSYQIERVLRGVDALNQRLIDRGYPLNNSNLLPHYRLMGERPLYDKDISYFLNTVEQMIKVFYIHPDAPNLPKKLTHFKELNDFEYNLYLLEQLLNLLESNLELKFSGTFKSGSAPILPLKGG